MTKGTLPSETVGGVDSRTGSVIVAILLVIVIVGWIVSERAIANKGLKLYRGGVRPTRRSRSYRLERLCQHTRRGSQGPLADPELERASAGDFATEVCTSNDPNDNFWFFSRAARRAYWDSRKIDRPTHLVDHCPLTVNTLALPTKEEEAIVQLAL